MGEHGRAVASLWLEHVPSIGLAIGPRHYLSSLLATKSTARIVLNCTTILMHVIHR